MSEIDNVIKDIEVSPKHLRGIILLQKMLQSGTIFEELLGEEFSQRVKDFPKIILRICIIRRKNCYPSLVENQ